MNFLKKYGSYFFKYHLFIAATAVALSIETAVLLHKPFNSVYLYLFIFFSTLFAYNIYYIKTPHAKPYIIMSAIALLGALSAFLFLDIKSIIHVVFISIASCIYIFPVFFPFEKDKNFTLQKLLLLTFVWVCSTFILPALQLTWDTNTILYILYRNVLLLFSCVLFFIRDEKSESLKKKAMSFAPILIIIQAILSLVIMFTANITFGFVFLFISFLCVPLYIFFNVKKRENLQYLIWADGILFLQSIIVILIYSTNKYL